MPACLCFLVSDTLSQICGAQPVIIFVRWWVENQLLQQMRRHLCFGKQPMQALHKADLLRVQKPYMNDAGWHSTHGSITNEQLLKVRSAISS